MAGQQVTDDGVVAAGVYDGTLRAALLAYKERGRRDLARPLGELLGAAVLGVGGAALRPLLVPMPSARAVAASRGGNHVHRLARQAAVATGLRAAPGGLRLVRTVRDSSGLSVEQRHNNIAGAMQAAPGHGRPAIVVDDIVTTGASIAEARRALAVAGWRPLGSAVVAATERRFPRGDA